MLMLSVTDNNIMLRLNNNLFIFFSHMNWSIHSVGKLTIRMIHVHIVIQCHS